MLKHLTCVIAPALFMIGCSQVHAAIVTTTYFGTIVDGGYSGVFGTEGDLAGRKVKLQFRYSSDFPHQTVSYGDGFGSSYAESIYGPVYASATVGGVEIPFGAVGRQTIALARYEPMVGTIYNSAIVYDYEQTDDGVFQKEWQSYINVSSYGDFAVSADYTLGSNVHVSGINSGYHQGSFIYNSIYTPNGGEEQYLSSVGMWFYVDRVTSGTVSSVPESSSWALMILGFTMIGGVCRQARRNDRRCITRGVASAGSGF